jgi:hypothetical protein
MKVRSIPYRTSLYIDDLMLFVRPNAQDLQLVRPVFTIYKATSGLGCNLAKCQLEPIRCDEELTQLAHGSFPCQYADFLVKYLGIPLSVSKLSKSVLHPLPDQVANRLLVWKGNLMNRSGHLAIIKSGHSSSHCHCPEGTALVTPSSIENHEVLLVVRHRCGSGGMCLVA